MQTKKTAMSKRTHMENTVNKKYHVGKFCIINLLLWRHFDSSSVRLFSNVAGSAVAIMYFSVMHRLHLLVPHLYGEACAAMDHFITYGFSLALRFQMCVDSRAGDQFKDRGIDYFGQRDT